MASFYKVETPEQLRELEAYCKTDSVKNLATVWSADRRRNGGHSVMDGKVTVVFSGKTASERAAYVMRTNAQGAAVTVAWLIYSTASKWCKEHLPLIKTRTSGHSSVESGSRRTVGKDVKGESALS